MDSDIIAEMRWTMADNPVTNAEYAAFVAAGGDPDWPGPCGTDQASAAAWVDYDHAVAYCNWRTAAGEPCRLPTDAEWQTWMDALPPDDPRRLVDGRSVWEWTATVWGDDCPDARRVVRGGSWSHVYRGARAAYRYGDDPGNRLNHVGFRVVRAAPGALASGVAGSGSDVPALLARIAALEATIRHLQARLGDAP